MLIHLAAVILLKHLDDDRAILSSDQANLSGLDSTSLHRCSMVTSKVAVHRHVLVKVRQKLLSTRSVAPVTHQVADNGKERVHLHTSLGHLVVCGVTDELGGRAGSLDVGENGVPGSTERQGQEGGTHVGSD